MVKANIKIQDPRHTLPNLKTLLLTLASRTTPLEDLDDRPGSGVGTPTRYAAKPLTRPSLGTLATPRGPSSRYYMSIHRERCGTDSPSQYSLVPSASVTSPWPGGTVEDGISNAGDSWRPPSRMKRAGGSIASLSAIAQQG